MHGPVPPKAELWAFLAQTSVQPGGLQLPPHHTLLREWLGPSLLLWKLREKHGATESRSSFTLSVHSQGSRSREGVSIPVPGSPRWGTLSPPHLPALVALPHAEPREEGGARHQDALGAENHTAAWAAAADPAPRTLQEFRGCVLSQARLQGSAKLILRPKDRYDSQSPPARDPSAASVLRKARSPERRGGAAGAPQGGLDRGGVSGRSPSPNRWGGASRGG